MPDAKVEMGLILWLPCRQASNFVINRLHAVCYYYHYHYKLFQRVQSHTEMCTWDMEKCKYVVLVIHTIPTTCSVALRAMFTTHRLGTQKSAEKP